MSPAFSLLSFLVQSKVRITHEIYVVVAKCTTYSVFFLIQVTARAMHSRTKRLEPLRRHYGIHPVKEFRVVRGHFGCSGQLSRNHRDLVQ